MNIVDYQNAMDKVSKIRVRQYEMKCAPGKKQIGFLAQELQKVYPQAVRGSPDDDAVEKPMGVDYGKLTPMLIKAIQEQQTIIKSLEKRIGQLENQ